MYADKCGAFALSYLDYQPCKLAGLVTKFLICAHASPPLAGELDHFDSFFFPVSVTSLIREERFCARNWPQ
jgi:hypothetical protein